MDGRELLSLRCSDLIRVRKARRQVLLATLPGISFFELLREKLKWSGSALEGPMITIADILRPDHIDLDLKQANQQEAVLHVANLLRNDERVWTGTASTRG